jgi:predicted transcriptional regulator
MIQIDEQNLKHISQLSANTLVRELCNQIEDIEKQNLEKDIAFSLLKNLLKNSVHNTFRNNIQMIFEYSKGFNQFKIDFIKPDR